MVVLREFLYFFHENACCGATLIRLPPQSGHYMLALKNFVKVYISGN